jgi:hypothetical protein
MYTKLSSKLIGKDLLVSTQKAQKKRDFCMKICGYFSRTEDALQIRGCGRNGRWFCVDE